MYKIIIVHDCAECPYRKWRPVSHTSIDYCEKCEKDIMDITEIPEWCPLENKKLRGKLKMNTEEFINKHIKEMIKEDIFSNDYIRGYIAASYILEAIELNTDEELKELLKNRGGKSNGISKKDISI